MSRSRSSSRSNSGRSRSEAISDRVKNQLRENLVGERIGEELNRFDAAENGGFRKKERGEVSWSGRGLIEVSLREVVNPRMEGGDLHGGSGADKPECRVENTRLRRR